jgi:tetratricopeptide (TPR) repeat protein
MSLYRLAETIEKLSYTNPYYSWHEALDYYLKAYKTRPHRAEPLINIAYYYVNQHDMNTAFLFARRATEIAYPHTDILFVQKYAYDYLRWELLARSAWYIGEFEIGENAAKKAFFANPDYEIAYYNLQCYLNRKLE